MSENTVVGIIGGGFVGAAHYAALDEQGYDTLIYDTDPDYRNRFPQWNLPKPVDSIEELVETTDVILVCVPTPPWDYSTDGKCGQANISIVQDVLSKIDIAAADLEEEVTVCIKSTVPPGTTSKLAGIFTNLHLHFSPEFLTEVDPLGTLQKSTRIVLGSEGEYDGDLLRILQYINKRDPELITCSNTEAELIKYFSNVFLLSKITLFNFYYDVAARLGCDYETVRKGVALDNRIGDSHTYVPGPDGLRGAGGSCFMKDIGALIHTLCKLEMHTELLDVVEQSNAWFRPEQDWVQNRYRHYEDPSD